MWVALSQSVKGLNVTKRLTLPPVGRNSSSLTAAPEILVFFSLWTKTEKSVGLEKSLWVLSLYWFSGLQTQTGVMYQLSQVSSLSVTELGTFQPPLSHEPVPYNNSLSLTPFIYIQSPRPAEVGDE